MDLTVAIVNWNTRDLLHQCLESMYATMKGIEVEVIVVDNASSDGSADMVRESYPQVRLIENTENVGFARANNQAYRLSRGTRILLLNPDTILHDGAVAQLMETMDRDESCAVVAPKLLWSDGRVQPSAGVFPTLLSELCDALYLNMLLGGRYSACFRLPKGDGVQMVDWASGACLLARRSALGDPDRVFDERYFMFSEETDLCKGLRGRGWGVCYDPRAVVTHLGSASTSKARREMFTRIYQSKFTYFLKQHGPFYANVYRFGVLPVHVACRMLGYLPGLFVRKTEYTGEHTHPKSQLHLLRSVLSWGRETSPRTTTESASRPLVVIIRGNWISKRDTQYYEPLLDRYDLLGVSIRQTTHDLSLVRFPVVTPWSADCILGLVPPIQRLLDRATGLRSENLMYFLGLDKVCRGASIIDVAETFHPFCLQAVSLRRRNRCRLVVRAHENIPSLHSNLAYRRRVKEQIFEWADAYIACSEMGRRTLELEGAPAERIVVIPMATDVVQYAPREKSDSAMRRLDLEPDDLVLLFAGRFVWSKGIMHIIDAAALVARDIPELKVVFLGSGPCLERMQQRIAERGLQDIVRLPGQVPVNAMADLYSTADIVAVPSIATPESLEQFGAVVIEAMACAKPLVVSDCGAIPDVIGDAGIVVPQANYLALAEAVRSLASDAALRETLGKKARERCVRYFSNEVVAEQIGKLYQQLLQ